MTYIGNSEHKQDIQNKADMIWAIADVLTGPFKPHEYGQVTIPLTVLRRLDCALIDKRPAIQEKYKQIKNLGLSEDLMSTMLEQASGLKYYDLNQGDLRTVLEDPKHVGDALRNFINNFSPNVRNILNEFKMFEQIERLEDSSTVEGGLLYAVIDRITQHDLSPSKISDIDMGYIFEEIIRKFSESYNEDAGQHYTPRDAIDLMVEILIRDEDKSVDKVTPRTILDPACGTGGMLSEAREYMSRINPKVSLQCYGQEYNPETYAICCANSLIKDATYNNVSEIKKGDTLSNYQFKGKKVNYVISNPPFGREWKVEHAAVEREAADLENGRFTHGLPAIGDSQMLFLSTAISAMESPYEGSCTGGRVAIIHNGSPLFTGDAGSGPSKMRQYILENDLLDAIIALPENIFYNTGIGTYIWVLDNNKKTERRGKVQLIDGSKMFIARRKSVGNKRVDIDQAAIAIVSQAYREFKNETYESEGRVCGSKIIDASEFGYVKISIKAPALDENGKVVKNKRGAVVYDKSKNDTENVPLGVMGLKPNMDYLNNPEIKQKIEEYMDKEVRPYVKFAEIDEKKSKVGFEIPFTRYFYKYVAPRSPEEIKAEILELDARIAELMKKIN